MPYDTNLNRLDPLTPLGAKVVPKLAPVPEPAKPVSDWSCATEGDRGPVFSIDASTITAIQRGIVTDACIATIGVDLAGDQWGDIAASIERGHAGISFVDGRIKTPEAPAAPVRITSLRDAISPEALRIWNAKLNDALMRESPLAKLLQKPDAPSGVAIGRATAIVASPFYGDAGGWSEPSSSPAACGPIANIKAAFDGATDHGERLVVLDGGGQFLCTTTREGAATWLDAGHAVMDSEGEYL